MTVQYSRKLFSSFILIVVLILNSCATVPPVINQPKRPKQTVAAQTKNVVDLTKGISSQQIRKKLDQFKNALNKGDLNVSDWKLHDELLEHYIQLRRTTSSKLIIPANSRITLPFETYCLNSGRAPPSEREVYHWQKSKPGIKYYTELLALRRSGEIKQTDLQELLWNLENETRWDDYPDRLKAILQRVDPKASLKLPSQIKDQAKSLITDTIVSLPGVSEALDTYNFVKGKYYTYEDFKTSVESLTSKHELSRYDDLTQIPGTDVYSQSESEGYSNQNVTFYNPTNQPQELDLTEYYLAPERKDVQRIGINPTAKDPTLLSDLEKTLYETMARLGIGFTPVVNDVADLYELLTGKDFITGEQLTFIDRSLSGVGIIVGSGAAYRYAKRAVYSPAEYLDDFSKGLGKASGKKIDLETKDFEVSKNALEQSHRQVEPLKSNYSNLKETLQLLRENRISRDERRRIVEAFTPKSTTKTTTEDVEVYRYFVNGKSSERGNWVTKEKSSNPEVNLALPEGGPYQVKEWIIPKGTKVIEGLVSPNFGKAGGGHQIYVPNKEVLK